MVDDSARLADEVRLRWTRNSHDLAADRIGLTGRVTATCFAKDGAVRWCVETHNLITQVGDQYFAERATGIASPPGQVTGMKLGTGSTAVAKTGAGAALTTYLSGSDVAIDGGFPASSLSGSSRQIAWQTTWNPGVATTASTITEAVIVIDALANATSTAANTIARALLSGAGAKAAGDTLVVVWNHLALGA
ncbi:MAG TPA: hypothetical protein VGL75_00930 [Acidothermaceae bacterium]|jgi:hypothetical protein